jgi:putative oxidoreductase
MEHVLLLGRFLLGGYFLFAGINHFTNTKALAEAAKKRGVLEPVLLTLFSGFIVVFGALGILFWIIPGAALLSLAIFLILTGAIMHPFWLFTNAAPEVRMLEMRFFFGNIALAGALMILATRTISYL